MLHYDHSHGKDFIAMNPEYAVNNKIAVPLKAIISNWR